MNSIERREMHRRDPFDCTVGDTETTVKSITGGKRDETRATTRMIIALCQIDTATRRFIVKATALVYHRCLIAGRMMIIVGDVVSEIGRLVFQARPRSFRKRWREAKGERERDTLAH